MTPCERTVADPGFDDAPVSLLGEDHYADLVPALVDGLGLGLAEISRELVIDSVSHGFCRLFGRTPANLTGACLTGLVSTGDRERLWRQLALLFEGRRKRFTQRAAASHVTGSMFSAEITGITVRRDGGGRRAVLVIIRPDAGRFVPPAGHLRRLSPTEARILSGLATGVTSARIAGQLDLSRQGVDYHVAALLRKFDVLNRPALVAKAYALGYFKPCWPPQVAQEQAER